MTLGMSSIFWMALSLRDISWMALSTSSISWMALSMGPHIDWMALAMNGWKCECLALVASARWLISHAEKSSESQGAESSPVT